MLIYSILKAFNSIVFALISVIPTFETPVWFSSQLPDVLFRIASFNWYLPVYETISVVLFLLGFTLTWKVAKILLNIVHIDLNS